MQPMTPRPGSEGNTVEPADRPRTQALSRLSTTRSNGADTLPVEILTRLIELSFEPIIVWDWDAGILEWNRGCEQLYGYPRAETLGRTPHELLQTRFPHPLAEIRQALEKNRYWSGELRHLTRAGSEVMVESRWQLMHLDGRSLVLEANRDISQRKRAERELRESEAQARAQAEEIEAIYAAAPTILCVLDRSLRYVRVNEQLAEANGIPAAAHIGRSVREIVPDLTDAAEAMLLRVLDGEAARGIEFVGTTPAQPGVVRTWLNNWVPFRNSQGEIVGITVSAEEITQEKAAQEALRKADRQKDEFLAMLAHELRNPLAPIRKAAVLLTHEVGNDPKVGALAAMVSRHAQQLGRLLDDLLDVSRIAAGRITLKTEPLEIGDLVDPAIEMVQPLVSEKSHRLRVDRPGQPLYVHGDRARLVQCLCNLLHNAAKYTDPGGEIMLMVSDASGGITFEVRDNGAGIPPDLLPHVFDLFVQGDRSLDRSQGGLGIGLSIVKRIVDMHRGTVSAASAGPGRGATFEIQLPRVEAPERPVTDVADQTGSQRRILVVDDNSDAADSLAVLLRLEGHEVETAYSAPGVLDAVRRAIPDVILLDIGLPQMSGYEVARLLRADPRAVGIHLIALTGYGQEHDRERSVEAGFTAHLVKPADIEAVNRILASLKGST